MIQTSRHEPNQPSTNPFLALLSFSVLGCLGLGGPVLAASPPSPPAANLHASTLKTWDHYVEVRETQIEKELASGRGFLASDFLSAATREGCDREIQKGEVCVVRFDTHLTAGVRSVPKGMIHHWLGVVFVPDSELDSLLSWLQEYDSHHQRFQDVESSSILEESEDRFRIHLRLRRKKVVTVHYNTVHEVEYRNHGAGRASSRSIASRIAQIDNPGDEPEREKPIGKDSGFLWRWRSYWRFQEVAGGVLVECESLSLSRGIPKGLGWLVGRFVDSVPRNSLTDTLRAVASRGGRQD